MSVYVSGGLSMFDGYSYAGYQLRPPYRDGSAIVDCAVASHPSPSSSASRPGALSTWCTHLRLKCISSQETIYGTKTLQRPEAIEEALDPD